MRILITGALGHIGSRLIRKLPQIFPDASIIMIDNLSTQRYCSLFHLPEKSSYTFIEGDIISLDLLKYTKDADVVIHLAAIADASNTFHQEVELEKINFTGTKRIADACLNSGSHLIFTSSTSIYDGYEGKNFDRVSLDTLTPHSPYARSKVKEERYINKLRTKGLSATIVRLGTICGVSPGMRFHTAVNKFCWQAVYGQPITVWRTSYDQVRPYADLSDVVRGMCWCMQQKKNNTYHIVTENRTVHSVIEDIRKNIPSVSISFVEHEMMTTHSYEVDSHTLITEGGLIQGNITTCIQDTISLLHIRHE